MDIGTLGEIAVSKYFISLGYDIFISVNGRSSTDLVAEKENIVYRVQVKTTSSKRNGKWIVRLSNRRNNKKNKYWRVKFDAKKYDFLAVYIVPEDRVVLLNPKKMHLKSQIVIKPKEN